MTALVRTWWYSGARKRKPKREFRMLNCVRGWVPAYVPGRATWPAPAVSEKLSVESVMTSVSAKP